MKYLKVFERFSPIDVEDIYLDIKSITYILEEDGYEVKLRYMVKKLVNGKYEFHFEDNKVDLREGELYLGIIIDVDDRNGDSGELINDTKRFLEILREHLDYIDIDYKNINLVELNGKPLSRIFVDLR